MRESIYYCKRRLCATSYFFFNLLLLFASHIVNITIIYFSLCFISYLVSSRQIAYNSINLYLIFKHFLILACIYAHILFCALKISHLLIIYLQQDSFFYTIYTIKFIAFACSKYCICLYSKYCICLLFTQRDFSTSKLFMQQYFYNF